MDHKKIRENINNYYVRGEEVVSFSTHEVVEDETTRIEVMLSAYLYEEAVNRHKGADMPLDEILDRMVTVYGINGTKIEVPENKLVWSILGSDGHVEEEFLDESATGKKYQMLTGPNKNLGISVLRYLARKEGFDIENLEITVDSSNFQEKGTSKITIDFTKGPVLERRPIREKDFTLEEDTDIQTDEQSQIEEYTNTEDTVNPDLGAKPNPRRYQPDPNAPKLTPEEYLELAKQNGNVRQIQYWEKVISGNSGSPFKVSPDSNKDRLGSTIQRLEDTKRKVANFLANFLSKRKNGTTDASPTDPDIKYIDDQIKEAADEISKKYWEDMKDIVLGTTQPEQTPDSDTPQEDPYLTYVKNKLEEAKKFNLTAEITHWENMIRLSDPQVQKNLSYANEQLTLAKEAHDEVSIERWENIVNEILYGHPDTPAPQLEEPKNKL